MAGRVSVPVRIYSLEHASSALPSGKVRDVKALCDPCLKDRLAKGWSVLDKRASYPPVLTCSDCEMRRRAAK
jgi:hypothetical protein